MKTRMKPDLHKKRAQKYAKIAKGLHENFMWFSFASFANPLRPLRTDVRFFRDPS